MILVAAHNKHRLWPVFFFVFSSAFYVAVVWPSLGGGFVLDDWPNLGHLSGAHGAGFWQYIFDGVTGNLGRPLAYLSFALQADSWPDVPGDFRLVNIILHLVNAYLVYLFCHLCRPFLNLSTPGQRWFAVVTAGLWLILPLHSTAVFYIVQRMTLMSATFTLLGLTGFVYAYRRVLDGRRIALAWMLGAAAISMGYLLGVLAKENGILLGIYILCTYYCFLLLQKPESATHPSRAIHYSILVVSGLPILTTVVYLFWGNRYMHAYVHRDFSPAERLLTETRILWEYVQVVFFPTTSTINLFNDGTEISKSLTKPIGTLLSLLAWMVVVVTPFFAGPYASAILFGVFWFIGGHLLESTILGLELNFYHRNYLPSLGLIFSLVLVIFKWMDANKGKFLADKAVPLFFVIYFVWNLTVLRIEATIWGDDYRQALASLVERKQSLRAHQYAAAYFANQSDFLRTLQILDIVDSKWPGYPDTVANKVLISCLDENVIPPDGNLVAARFREGRFDRGVVPTMKEVLIAKSNSACTYFTWEDYRSWLNALRENKKMLGQSENILVLIAHSYSAENRYSSAADILAERQFEKSDANYILLRVRFLALAGRDEEALELLDDLTKHGEKKVSWGMYNEKVVKLKDAIMNKRYDERDK